MTAVKGPRVDARDEHGLVGKSVVITMILIAVIGVGVIEGASILFTRLSLQNTADQVAADASLDYNSNHSSAGAQQVALQSLKEHDEDAHLVNIQFDVPKAGDVTVKIKKKATTFIVQHVSFLKKLAVAKVTATSGPSSG
jgi:Flp pilus assembly protein TadG